jgi:hypothetical protein
MRTYRCIQQAFVEAFQPAEIEIETCRPDHARDLGQRQLALLLLFFLLLPLLLLPTWLWRLVMALIIAVATILAAVATSAGSTFIGFSHSFLRRRYQGMILRLQGRRRRRVSNNIAGAVCIHLCDESEEEAICLRSSVEHAAPSIETQQLLVLAAATAAAAAAASTKPPMQLDSTSLELRKSHCRPSAIPPGHLRVTWREAKRGVVKRTRLAVQQTELVLPVDHIAAAVTTWQRSAAPDGKGDLPASPQQILDDLAARLPRTNHQNTPRRELRRTLVVDHMQLRQRRRQRDRGPSRALVGGGGHDHNLSSHRAFARTDFKPPFLLSFAFGSARLPSPTGAWPNVQDLHGGVQGRAERCHPVVEILQERWLSHEACRIIA